MAPTALLQHGQLADFLAVGIAAADSTGRQVYVNRHLARMLGWEEAELVGATPPYVYWPADEIERIGAAFERTIRGDAPPEGFELRFQRRDGSLVDVLVQVVEAQGDDGAPLWLASVTDFTHQRGTRERHRLQEQRLELALNAGRLGAWEWDVASGTVAWSPMLEQIHGIPVGSFDGTFEAYQADIHPEDRERVLAAIGRTATGDEEHHLEYRIVWPDGSTHWLEAWGQLVRDETGRPVRMVGVCSDVTERVLAEQRLREAVESSDSARLDLQEILEGIGDPFVVYTADWRFRYVNAAAAATFERLGHRNVLGHTLWELFPDLDGSPFGKALRDAAAARRTVIFEEYRAASSAWAEVHCFPMPDGGVGALWKTTTERKRAEEALHYLAETGRLLGASLDWEATVGAIARVVVPQLADWCSVTVADEDGALRQVAVAHADPERVRWARDLARRYPPQPGAPSGAAAVIRTGQPELINDVSDAMLVAAARDEEHLRLMRELGLRSVLVVPLTVGDRTFGALTLISAEQGRRYAEADLALALEIARRAALAVEHARLFRESEAARAQAEEHLLELELQAEELRTAREAAEKAGEAKAAFLATMSHELRTPLNAIMGYTQLLLLGVPESLSPAASGQVGRIERASHHLLSVIDEILTFSRIEAGRERIDIGAVDLAELSEEVTAVIQPLASARGLAFRTIIPPDAAAARTDARKLRQILVNLLGNAVKFTDSGSIELEIELDADSLLLHVRDTGVGIARDQLENVFEPFHQLDNRSTREVQGSGLGLAVSRRLARLLGGDIAVTSEVGVGSTFTVVLPTVEGEEAQAGIRSPA